MNLSTTTAPKEMGQEFIRIHGVFWCVIYLALYYPLRNFLPENTLRDAELIAELMQSGPGSQSQSFIYTAALLDAIPEFAQDIFVNIIGCTTILLITLNLRRALSFFIAPLIVLPLMVTNIMSPTKETIVLMMGLIIFFTAHKSNHPGKLLFTIIFLYGAYGATIRIYYLLILALLLCFYVWPKLPIIAKAVLLAALGVALLLLPPELYEALQGSRDKVATYFSTTSQHIVRTFFDNPFPPDNFWHFLLNYGNAVMILNMPLILFQTWKEWLLLINVIVWWYLTFVGLQKLKGNLLILTQLFFSHLLVLQLFEPDLGSYLRHASSVFIYLVPALLGTESRLWARPAAAS